MKRLILAALASYVAAGVLAPALSGQFLSPIPKAEFDLTALTAAGVPVGARDKIVGSFPQSTFIWLPGLRGRLGAKALYEQADFRAFGELAADLREDQAIAMVEIISGAVGVLPFEVRSAFVVAKNDTASISTASGPKIIEGTRSDLTALMRNGGNVAARTALPLFMTFGPNVRSSMSLAGELGVLGNIVEPDSLRASYTLAVDGAVALSIRELGTGDAVIGSLLLPMRIGWAGSFSDLAPGIIDRTGFGFFQLGVGITKKSGDAGVSLIYTRPFSPDVRDQMPRFMVSLRAALPGG